MKTAATDTTKTSADDTTEPAEEVEEDANKSSKSSKFIENIQQTGDNFRQKMTDYDAKLSLEKDEVRFFT